MRVALISYTPSAQAQAMTCRDRSRDRGNNLPEGPASLNGDDLRDDQWLVEHMEHADVKCEPIPCTPGC